MHGHAWRAAEPYTERQPYCLVVFFYAKFWKGGGWLAGKVKKRKTEIQRICPGSQRFVLVPRFAFASFLTTTLFALTGMPVLASDIFGTAKNAMQTVYTDVAGIATVAAVVCAAVCLFLMNFSKSGRTVDESRAWLKRIVVCWAALMTLGAIVTYLEKIIPKSMFTG